MTEPIFIDVPYCKGVVSTSVEILQLQAIGRVSKALDWSIKEAADKPSVRVYAPRDMEDWDVILFATEDDRDTFVAKFAGMLRRKATVVTI